MMRVSPPTFLAKMKGHCSSPGRACQAEIWLAFAGSALALAAIGMLHIFSLDTAGLPLFMAPFGASAVLVFGAWQSPLAQPRNVVGGHALSALVGVSVGQAALAVWPAGMSGHAAVGEVLAVSVAVAGAIALMHLTKTLHPPGGATAFVAVSGGLAVQELGYWYVLTPCALGGILMVAIALIVHNIVPGRRYPVFWR